MLMTKIKKDLSKWREMPLFFKKRSFSIVKLSILSKLIYSFNAIPIKFPAKCFVDIHKLILKIYFEMKGPRIAKTI